MAQSAQDNLELEQMALAHTDLVCRGRHPSSRPTVRIPAPSAMTYAWSYRPTDLAWVKEQAGVTVSVCLPARDEAATIGRIVETIRGELQLDVPLVDELLVFDDGSADATARIAHDAGATVVAADTILPQHGAGIGKGDVLWRSLAASMGDLVVWCDADIEDFGAQFIYGLVGPLLVDDRIEFVKGAFDRPGGDGGGGGRVTELLARPLLARLRPDLACIEQPLSGSYGGRRALLEQLSFEPDFGVDVGLLIDVADFAGIDAIAQVHLGEFKHEHRPLHDLGAQADSVARAILDRAGPDRARVNGWRPVLRPPVASLRRPAP